MGTIESLIILGIIAAILFKTHKMAYKSGKVSGELKAHKLSRLTA